MIVTKIGAPMNKYGLYLSRVLSSQCCGVMHIMPKESPAPRPAKMPIEIWQIGKYSIGRKYAK